MNKYIKGCMTIMILSNVFIIANLLTTCALAHEFHYEVIDEPLKPYVADYVTKVLSVCPDFKFTKNYVIEITESLPKDEWIGVCISKVNGFHIQIRESWWISNNNNVSRQELVDHEMAHCILHKEHDPNPSNYMYESLNEDVAENYVPQVLADIKAYCDKK